MLPPVAFRETRRALLCGGILTFLGSSCVAATCAFDVMREANVAEVRDGTTFRLKDGQEVRLAGIVTAAADRPDHAKLSRLVQDREVVLRSPKLQPDRYGRLSAIVYVKDQPKSVQAILLRQGDVVMSGDIPDNAAGRPSQDCAGELRSEEAVARQAKLGFWSSPSAIKNAERPDDILPWIGQFVVAEGKITSVREAGGTVYINFGRRWTRDFAVTIAKRLVRGFEAAGIAPKTLEGRTVRVRGWVEQRGGPRIEAFGPGQVELADDR